MVAVMPIGPEAEKVVWKDSLESKKYYCAKWIFTRLLEWLFGDQSFVIYHHQKLGFLFWIFWYLLLLQYMQRIPKELEKKNLICGGDVSKTSMRIFKK